MNILLKNVKYNYIMIIYDVHTRTRTKHVILVLYLVYDSNRLRVYTQYCIKKHDQLHAI